MNIFKNNTHLPMLIEFWNYEKINNYQKKRQLQLYNLVIKPKSYIKIKSINNNYYISSLFGNNDIENNKLWDNNNIPTQMLFYIDNTNIVKKTELCFNCYSNDKNIYNISYLE